MPLNAPVSERHTIWRLSTCILDIHIKKKVEGEGKDKNFCVHHPCINKYILTYIFS